MDLRSAARSTRARLRELPRAGTSVGYLLAAAIPLLTAGLHAAFLTGPSLVPFFSFHIAVALVAAMGGFGPGVIALALSAALGNNLFTGPFNALGSARLLHEETLLFLASGAAIVALAASLRAAIRRAEDRTAVLRRYELLAGHTRDIVLFIDAESGRILEANEAAVMAYGYSRPELLARTIQDLRASEVRSETAALMAQASARGLMFESLHLRKDGTRFPVEVSARGERLGFTPTLISVVRDISERRKSEALLRESELRVRTKLEAIVSPAVDVGSLELQDVIDAPATQSLMEDFYALAHVPLGIIDSSGKVLVGVGWQDVCTKFHRVHPVTCAHCIESDTQLTEGLEPGEFKLYRCKNHMWDAATPVMLGTRKVGNVFTGQFFFDDERPDYALFAEQARKYGFDEEAYLSALQRVPRLTRQQATTAMRFLVKLANTLSQQGYANVKLARALHEREQLTDSLREADRRRTQYISLLSHELRNPLTPVRNSLHILRRADPGSVQADRALEVIDRQTAHLIHLVDDLLDMTRASNGKIRLQKSPVCLNELLTHLAEDHRSAFAAAEVSLRLSLPEQPLRVEADATRLAQIVGNLLQNAAKFTPHGGETSLALASDERGALVAVSDNGVGIAPEVLGNLFQPFVQADETLDRAQGGLGIGLALSKALAELHAGTLTAHSEGPGRGARFELTLPLARPAAQDAEPEVTVA